MMSPTDAAVAKIFDIFDLTTEVDSPLNLLHARTVTTDSVAPAGMRTRRSAGAGSLYDAMATNGQRLDVDAGEQDPIVEAAQLRPRIVHREAEARFRALHQFQGTVVEVLAEEFVARTRDITNPSYADEIVTLPLDDVPPGDRELLTVGAVFYWLIGYEEDDEGSRKRTSILRFRRLPAWSGRAVKRVNETAAHLMRRFADR